ncbi:MAG: mechanosensitive ion channel family protein [Methanotrichaceae archaeon]|nr:mechanosensitive ion channel family protein [Methanotrichaceae archaeon]
MAFENLSFENLSFENLTYDVASLWIWPLIFILSGIIVGAIFEKFILPKLIIVASRTKFAGANIILTSLRRYVFLWFVLAGFLGALYAAPIPESVRKVLGTIWFLIAGFSIVIAFAQTASDLLTFYAKRRKGILQATTMFKVLIFTVTIILGIFIIFKALKIDVTPMLAALGIGGLAVALALQDPLGNFFSGLHILASSEIRPGDYLKLDSGDEGFVTDISWRTATIRTLSNNTILVPNLKLSQSIITNFHLTEQQLSVPVELGVSYDSDLEKVEKITIEVAKAVLKDVPGGVLEFEPGFRFTKFGDSSIDLTVILRARDFNYQYPIRHEFIKRLHKRYGEEGIEIPYPMRNLYIRELNPTSKKG